MVVENFCWNTFQFDMGYSNLRFFGIGRQKYCYAYGNDLVSFNITYDKIKAKLTHTYIELIISKSTTTSV